METKHLIGLLLIVFGIMGGSLLACLSRRAREAMFFLLVKRLPCEWGPQYSLTILVTPWWEYFRDRQPDNSFIEILNQTAAWLSDEPDVKVISFDQLTAQ